MPYNSLISVLYYNLVLLAVTIVLRLTVLGNHLRAIRFHQVVYACSSGFVKVHAPLIIVEVIAKRLTV